MEINEPNDLLHFFYKYALKELPVSSEGEITGKLKKSAVVKFLSRSEQFDSNVVTTLERLVEPTDKKFLDQLTKQLEEGTIKGIPILRMNGDIDRIVTPGYLETKNETEQFFDESEKRQFYEEFIDHFPFPITLSRDGEQIFSNDAHEHMKRSLDWVERSYERDSWKCSLYLPKIVDDLFRDYGSLQSGEGIELRTRMEEIEECLLRLAEEENPSISKAAEQVGLPRQTFHYRRKN